MISDNEYKSLWAEIARDGHEYERDRIKRVGDGIVIPSHIAKIMLHDLYEGKPCNGYVVDLLSGGIYSNGEGETEPRGGIFAEGLETLTNLQITTLNGIGMGIAEGKDGYASYEGLLSESEDRYLRAWLEKEGIEIAKEDEE